MSDGIKLSLVEESVALDMAKDMMKATEGHTNSESIAAIAAVISVIASTNTKGINPETLVNVICDKLRTLAIVGLGDE